MTKELVIEKRLRHPKGGVQMKDRCVDDIIVSRTWQLGGGEAVTKEQAYQSLQRVKEIQRVASGLQAPVSLLNSGHGVPPFTRNQGVDSHGALFLAQLEHKFSSVNPTQLDDIPRLPTKKLRLKNRKPVSKSADSSPPARVPAISLNGEMMSDGRQEVSKVVNRSTHSQNNINSSRLNDFILRSGSPTAYQNSGSPTAYQNTTTSYQNVQLSPKILRIFDNNYKSSDHQNSHQHGMSRGMSGDINNIKSSSQQQFGGNMISSHEIVQNGKHLISTGQSLLQNGSDRRTPVRFQLPGTYISSGGGGKGSGGPPHDHHHQIDQRLGGSSKQQATMLPSPRQSENLLLNAQKELEVLLKGCDNVWTICPELLNSSSIVTLQLLDSILRTELKQAEEADSGLDSTDINIKLDLRRQKESKLAHLQSLSRLVEDMWKMRELYVTSSGQSAVSLDIQHRIQKLLSTLYGFDVQLSERKLETNLAIIQKESIQASGLCNKDDSRALELSRITTRIKEIHEELEDLGSNLAGFEHDLLILRQDLQKTAQQCLENPDMTSIPSPSSQQVLAIENSLKQVQKRAVALHTRRQELLQSLSQMRKSPSFWDFDSLLQSSILNRPVQHLQDSHRLTGTMGSSSAVVSSSYQRPNSPSMHQTTRPNIYTGPTTQQPPTAKKAVDPQQPTTTTTLTKTQSANLSAQSILADLKSQFNQLELDISQTQKANASARISRNQMMASAAATNPFLTNSTLALAATTNTDAATGSSWQQANVITNPFLQTTCTTSQQLLNSSQPLQMSSQQLPVSANPFVQSTQSIQSSSLANGSQSMMKPGLQNNSTNISTSSGNTYFTANKGNPFLQTLADTGSVNGQQQSAVSGAGSHQTIVTGTAGQIMVTGHGTGQPGHTIVTGTAGQTMVSGTGQPVQIPGDIREEPTIRPSDIVRLKKFETSLAEQTKQVPAPAPTGTRPGNNTLGQPVYTVVTANQNSVQTEILLPTVAKVQESFQTVSSIFTKPSAPGNIQNPGVQGSLPENITNTFHHFSSEKPFGNLETKTGDSLASWFNINTRKEGDQTDGSVASTVTSCGAPPGSLAPPTMYNLLSGANCFDPENQQYHYIINQERPSSQASNQSNQSEEEMIALIDEMTSSMFKPGNDQTNQPRSNSLPRYQSGSSEPLAPRPGSSTGVPTQSRSSSLNRQEGKMSAYHRLFGKDSAAAKDMAGTGKKKVPDFIQKAPRRKDKNEPTNVMPAVNPHFQTLGLRKPTNYPNPVDTCPSYQKASQPTEKKVDSTSIDKLFGAPDKIEIPERYVPEKEAAESASSGLDGGEERRRKMEKVESIRRMLGAQAPSTAGGPSQSAINLNEIIAKQVKEQSRRIAEEAHKKNTRLDLDNDCPGVPDLPHDMPIPFSQQRESSLL